MRGRLTTLEPREVTVIWTGWQADRWRRVSVLVAVLASSVACAVAAPACREGFAEGIVSFTEPGPADRAAVRIDPDRARALAMEFRAAPQDGQPPMPVGTCLGVVDPAPFGLASDEPLAAYLVKFEIGQATELVVVDAVTGEVVGASAVTP